MVALETLHQEALESHAAQSVECVPWCHGNSQNAEVT